MPTIDFTQLPPSSAPTFQRNGVTIKTNPNRKLVINQDNDSLGLGVDDATIDQGESVFVSFNQGAASDISYMLDTAATSDGDDIFGEAELEAFDVNGKSLGTVPLGTTASNTIIMDVSAAFDGQLISRFRLTQIESVRIGSLSFKPVPVLVAKADAVTTSEDDPVTFNVRKNDTFLLSGAPTITVNTDDLQGRLTNNGNGNFTYNPGSAFQSLTAGQTAKTSFKYTLAAGGRTSTATVTLMITGLDDAPIAQADSAILSEGQTVTIPVLSNDMDPDSDTLIIDSVTNPSSGTVIQNSDGTLTYTASPDFAGSDSFTYVVKDGVHSSQPATVTIRSLSLSDVGSHDTLTGTDSGIDSSSSAGSTSDDLLMGGLQSVANQSVANVGSAPESTVSQPQIPEFAAAANPLPELTPLISGLYGSGISTQPHLELGAENNGLSAPFAVAQLINPNP